MSKESKIKLFDLPKHILKSALSYLTVKELLYPIMETNKKLNEFANDPNVITPVFFGQIKVPLAYGGSEFAALKPEDKMPILKDILWPSGINEKLTMMAYYTDGGTQAGTQGTENKYFINNIYGDNPPNLYCTRRGENVHVKAICSDSLAAHVDLADISKYKVPKEKGHLYAYPDDTYCYPIKTLIGNHDPQNHKQFAIMKYHDLNRNLGGYTCFLQSFAVFISMEEIDVNHPLVRLFDGVKKLEQMEKFGFETMSLQNTEDTKVVEFNLSSLRRVEETLQRNVPGAKLNGVYPIIWGEVSAATTNYLNIMQRIGFRFILLKLIDSKKTGTELEAGNIDCYTFSLSGNLVKLRFSHEE